MIKLGDYHLCLLDLIMDGSPKTLSTTKIWTHLGYGFLSFSLLQHVHTHPLTFDLIMAYGGVVACHHSVVTLIKLKYGVKDNAPSPSGAADVAKG